MNYDKKQRLIALRDSMKEYGYADGVEELESIFPELTESEDERIIDNIIGALRAISITTANKDTYKEELTWLKKQKEQKPRLIGEDSVEKMARHMYETGQTIEQKPAEWSDTKELVFKDICNHLEVEGYSGWVVLLNALHNGEFQPKAEWSGKDEKMRWDLIKAFTDKNNSKVDEFMQLRATKADVIDWLKSLHPQPQRRDTYYDIIHNILDTLKDIDFMKITPEHRVSLLNDVRVKCKNADECAEILDEPYWKPSEEQMEAFRSYIKDFQDRAEAAVGGWNNFNVMIRLFEQLKKL